MTVITYAILTTLALIGVIELGKFETKPIAALILTAIAFIYVGFAGNDHTPAEYEWYCVWVDSGLAVYFYWKLSSKKSLI